MGKLLVGIITFILAMVAIFFLGIFIEVIWGTGFLIPFAIAAGIVFLFLLIAALL